MSLSKKIFWTLLITIILVIISYFFFDRQLANFIYAQHFTHRFLFLGITDLVPLFLVLSVLILVIYLIAKFVYHQDDKILNHLGIGSIGLLVTDQLKGLFKIFFARAWPTTWIHHNPSWISNHVYGFFWMRDNSAYASFPSGHMTVIVFVASILWQIYPKLRWLYVIMSFAVALSLLALNFHFLGDIMGGTAFGFIAGIITNAIIDKT